MYMKMIAIAARRAEKFDRLLMARPPINAIFTKFMYKILINAERMNADMIFMYVQFAGIAHDDKLWPKVLS